MPKTRFLFAGLCAAAVCALVYFANSAVTRSAPEYSTWNTGPKGAKLLFDGLQQAGLTRVSRELRPLNLERPSDSTVFFLDVKGYDLDSEDAEYFETLESAAARGNDVVLALTETAVFRLGSQAKKSLLESRWGVHLDKDAVKVDSQWKPLPGVAVAWRRVFGKGSVTLLGNGQRLSNTGIAKDAVNRVLLYQLVSRHPAVIFDESHLGIQESGSVVGLARHYHLQGLMFGFILLAAMFVWSRSVSFPPPPVVEQKVLIGSDTRSMLAELMSRYLNKDLIRVCVAEWNRTRGHGEAMLAPDEIVSGDKDAVAAYGHIQESLRQKAGWRGR